MERVNIKPAGNGVKTTKNTEYVNKVQNYKRCGDH